VAGVVVVIDRADGIAVVAVVVVVVVILGNDPLFLPDATGRSSILVSHPS